MSKLHYVFAFNLFELKTLLSDAYTKNTQLLTHMQKLFIWLKWHSCHFFKCMKYSLCYRCEQMVDITDSKMLCFTLNSMQQNTVCAHAA